MVTKRELEEEVSVLRDQLTEAASDAVDAGKDAAETARRALAATVEDKKDQLRAYAEAKGLTPDDLKGLGQRLATEIQEQEGIDDHRAPQSERNDERFAIRHPARVREGSCLAAIVGTGEIQVNSLHRQAIGDLAPGLSVEAQAPDGTVEAVSVTEAKAFALGVQWHPEYWAKTDETSAAIFRAFGAAARQRASARQSTAESAINRPAGATAS